MNKNIRIKSLISAAVILLSAALLCTGCKKQQSYDKATGDALLTHFYEIADIYRPAGSCGEISDYILFWAKEKGFDAVRDEALNVIVEIPASEGYEDFPVTILQSHMDMVYVSDEASSDNSNTEEISEYTVFEKDEEGKYVPVETTSSAVSVEIKEGKDKDELKIKPVCEDAKLISPGTSLGADNGIGMSVMLEYAENGGSHGPLRYIFTADKEADNLGAKALEEKYLSDAAYMINLDCCESTSLYCSSCGENTLYAFSEDYETQIPSKDTPVYIRVNGLVGGTASEDVKNNRLSALKLLASMLKSIKDAGIPFELSSFAAGSSSEEIANDAGASIVVDESQLDNVWTIVKTMSQNYSQSYGETEPNMECSITENVMPKRVLKNEDTSRLIEYLCSSTNGVLSDESWANTGIAAASRLGMGIKTSVRSSDKKELEEYTKELVSLAQQLGFEYRLTGNSQVWTGNQESMLVSKVKDAGKKIKGNDYIVRSSCEGLECGSFEEADPGLQIISIGPDIFDSHTSEEFCNMQSAAELYKIIDTLLPELK